MEAENSTICCLQLRLKKAVGWSENQESAEGRKRLIIQVRGDKSNLPPPSFY